MQDRKISPGLFSTGLAIALLAAIFSLLAMDFFSSSDVGNCINKRASAPSFSASISASITTATCVETCSDFPVQEHENSPFEEDSQEEEQKTEESSETKTILRIAQLQILPPIRYRPKVSHWPLPPKHHPETPTRPPKSI